MINHRIPTILRLTPALLMALTWCLGAGAIQIRDLCEVQGARENMLKGIGLVVGLAGTGDKAAAAVLAQQQLLDRLDVKAENVRELRSANTAVVMVTATIPAFAKEGTRIDVKVDSMYDCKSLEGGMLLETHLTGPGMDDTVYAVCQGAIAIGGFSASSGGGGSSSSGHVTSGRIPQGASVEREIPSTITDGERIVLLLKTPDFGSARNIQEALDKKYGVDSAVAMGAGTVRVTIPEEQRANLVTFVAGVLDMNVHAEAPARVVINERTGTIVVGGNVVIKPCQVAHGALTIKVTATPMVTPAVPFSDAQPVVTELRDVTAEQVEAHLMPVEGTSAGEVAQALNRLRVTPRDMISIFQALREAGSLMADLEIM